MPRLEVSVMENTAATDAQSPPRLTGSVLLRVEPVSCTMTLAHSGQGDTVRDSLHFEIRLPWRLRITTTGGHDLREAEWGLTLYNGAD